MKQKIPGRYKNRPFYNFDVLRPDSFLEFDNFEDAYQCTKSFHQWRQRREFYHLCSAIRQTETGFRVHVLPWWMAGDAEFASCRLMGARHENRRLYDFRVDANRVTYVSRMTDAVSVCKAFDAWSTLMGLGIKATFERCHTLGTKVSSYKITFSAG